MLQRCREQTQINKFFVEQPLKKVKDIVYVTGERATYEFDYTTKEFSNTPIDVIRKDRVEDLNVKGYCE